MRKLVIVSLFVVAALLALAACAPAATPAPQIVAQTVVVPQTVAVPQTVVAQQTVVVNQVITATPVPPTKAPTAVPTATIPAPVVTTGEGCATGSTKVSWFIGLGTGSQPDQVTYEKNWVDKFNKSQKDVCLTLNVVFNVGQNSYDALRAMIAGGNSPDIVGPVGKAGRASFQGGWADVAPLAQAAGYDLTKYDPALLEFMKDEGVLVGIPFAMFPSTILYNKKLFDEAKLAYPPHKVGDKYTLDGKQLDWTIDTMSQVAMKLTVDSKGNDSTNAAFDAKNIKQFGFVQQWPSDYRSMAALFGGGIPYDPATSKAVIPASYTAYGKWLYDAIWKYHFYPTADYANSDLLAKGNEFSSGNVAMAYAHTWYTCCYDMVKMNWDMGIVPSYNGKITAKAHGDTFAILKGSKVQAAAFKALTAMVNDSDLIIYYGGLPAITSGQPAFFTAMNAKVGTNKVDWQVAVDMLKYPDVPNHEAWLPNYAKSTDLMTTFLTNMRQTPGLNIDAELQKMAIDLNTSYAAAK
ncbi:MAG TPA: sugar ABC transporter substrate-binding protein [Anaerolineae bacterium]